MGILEHKNKESYSLEWIRREGQFSMTYMEIKLSTKSTWSNYLPSPKHPVRELGYNTRAYKRIQNMEAWGCKMQPALQNTATLACKIYRITFPE